MTEQIQPPEHLSNEYKAEHPPDPEKIAHPGHLGTSHLPAEVTAQELTISIWMTTEGETEGGRPAGSPSASGSGTGRTPGP